MRGDHEISIELEQRPQARDVMLATFCEPVLGAELAAEQRVAGEQRTVRRRVEHGVLRLHTACVCLQPTRQPTLHADELAPAVPLCELEGAPSVPWVRENDRDRQADTFDVSIERLEEALLLLTRNEWVDQA